MKKILKIEGMGCEHCIKSVKDTLKNIDCIELIEVKIGEITVDFKEESNIEEKIKEIVEKLDDVGYEVILF